MSSPESSRMTLSRVVERLTERHASSPDVPTYEVSAKAPTAEQTKAGIVTVFQWSVNVPVCEEFPTSAEAFAEALARASELRTQFPPERAK